MIQLAETTKHETTRQMETSRNEMADSIGPDGEYLFPELRQVTAAGDVVIDPEYLKPIEPSLAGEPGLNSQPDASQPTPAGDASGVPAEPPVEAEPVPVEAEPTPEPPVEAVPADPAPVEADPVVEAEPVPADPVVEEVPADPVVEAEPVEAAPADPASDDPLAEEPTT